MRMDNLFALAVALCLVCLSNAQNAQNDYNDAVSKAGEKCKMKVSLEEDIYKQLLSGSSMPTDQKVKCFLSCFMMELGYYQDGGFNEENARAFLMKRYGDQATVDKGTAIMRKCAEQDKSSENDCNFAYKIVQCMVREFATAKMGNPIIIVMSSSS